jgi:hypothetical protein
MQSADTQPEIYPVKATNNRTGGYIDKHPEEWTNFQGRIEGGKKTVDEDFQVIFSTGKKLKVEHSNNFVLLEGMSYKKDKETFEFHLTLTSNSAGEWTYFHVTRVGGSGEAYYYQLEYSDYEGLRAKPTADTLMAGKVKSVSKATHTGVQHPPELDQDISALMRIFIGSNYEKGLAIG